MSGQREISNNKTGNRYGWKPKEDDKLVALWKESRLFWDPSHPLRSDKKAKRQRRQEIANELRRSVEEVKKKMSGFKSSYVRAKAKGHKPSNWRLFPQLNFLDADAGLDQTTTAIAAANEAGDEEEEDEDEDDEEPDPIPGLLQEDTKPRQQQHSPSPPAKPRPWSEDKEEQLFCLWRDSPVLYDPADPKYGNQAVKGRRLDEMAAALGVAPDELRRKMKGLKSVWARERRKEGSKWRNLDNLNFLLKSCPPDPSLPAEKEISTISLDSYEEEEDEEVELVTNQSSVPEVELAEAEVEEEEEEENFDAALRNWLQGHLVPAAVGSGLALEELAGRVQRELCLRSLPTPELLRRSLTQVHPSARIRRGGVQGLAYASPGTPSVRPAIEALPIAEEAKAAAASEANISLPPKKRRGPPPDPPPHNQSLAAPTPPTQPSPQPPPKVAKEEITFLPPSGRPDEGGKVSMEAKAFGDIVAAKLSALPSHKRNRVMIAFLQALED